MSECNFCQASNLPYRKYLVQTSITDKNESNGIAISLSYQQQKTTPHTLMNERTYMALACLKYLTLLKSLVLFLPLTYQPVIHDWPGKISLSLASSPHLRHSLEMVQLLNLEPILSVANRFFLLTFSLQQRPKN